MIELFVLSTSDSRLSTGEPNTGVPTLVNTGEPNTREQLNTGDQNTGQHW